MIESYNFGIMVIDGQKYTSDLIIFPDRIKSSWWRITGHRLCLQDLESVIREEPEVLVVGTGFTGLMKVEEEVINYAQEKEMTLIIEKTKKATQRFNELAPTKKTIGAFHLTC
jgi:hypothetical protein